MSRSSRHLSTRERCFAAALLTVAVTACTPVERVLVGTVRVPINAAQVVIYAEPPARFAEIAILQTSNHTVLPGGQYDRMVERLQAQAAKLGANGLILEDFEEYQTTSIGTSVGTQSYSRHGSLAMGLDGAIGLYKTTAKGRAIYVSAR